MNYLHHITKPIKNLSYCQTLRRTSQQLSIHSTSDIIGLKEVHHISAVRNNLLALVCFVALTLLSGKTRYKYWLLKVLIKKNINKQNKISYNAYKQYFTVD